MTPTANATGGAAMASDHVTVSRALLRAALIDAIESVEELVDGGGGDDPTRKRLADYRRTLDRIASGVLDSPPGRPVPIQNLQPGPLRLPSN